jgi:hypothetical protein
MVHASWFTMTTPHAAKKRKAPKTAPLDAPADPVGTSEKDLHNDDLAEELGEAFLRGATGDEDSEEMLNEVVAEETGGPFVETTSEEEIAYDEDASNPPGATREPFPTS